MKTVIPNRITSARSKANIVASFTGFPKSPKKLEITLIIVDYRTNVKLN